MGLGLGHLGDQRIDIALRHGAVAQQFAVAFELQTGQIQRGAQSGQIGLVDLGIELHQGLPGGHLIARLEQDALDLTGDLVVDDHALDRLHIADRLQARLPALGLDLGRGDRRGGLRLRELSHALLDLLVFEQREPAAEQREQEKDEE